MGVHSDKVTKGSVPYTERETPRKPIVHENQRHSLAPGVGPNDLVILFDGVCKLCSAWARFLIRFDHRHTFKLALVQSQEGKAILAWYGMPTDSFETMLLVEGPRLYIKSTAFLRVMRNMPFPWRMAVVLRIVPGFLRDWLYDRIALNRYTIFGKFESCVLPHPDHERRFLKSVGA